MNFIDWQIDKLGKLSYILIPLEMVIIILLSAFIITLSLKNEFTQLILAIMTTTIIIYTTYKRENK